jgi:hypothetical protein
MKCWGALLCFILSSVLRAQSDSLILSEIMFYPVSGNNEFIELYNPGQSGIDLAGFRIKYYTSTPDTIIDAGNGTYLPPGGYAVIMEGDYDFTEGIYQNIIPPSALQLKITSNSFGSNGMANTTSRPIWLISPKGDTLDYYFYSADNTASVSDEKKVLFKDTSSVYWKNSLVKNGTPGFRNSVQQCVNDLTVLRFTALPALPYAGDDIEIYTVIQNNGVLASSEFIINIFQDINQDSIPATSELIHSSVYHNLSPGDSVTLTFSLYNVLSGSYCFIAEVFYPEDEFPLNNYAFIRIEVSEPAEYNSIIVNEIMYAPLNYEPEWVEIYNISSGMINLKKWKIGDALSSAVITNNDYYLAPDSFLVIAKDSSILSYYPFGINLIKASFPALNNTGDAVVIKDSLGFIVDSLYYFPQWGGQNNRSLERKLPYTSSLIAENWSTSINPFRATPGFKNSIHPKTYDAELCGFYIKEKYGTVGEEINFVICIKNNGTSGITGFSVSLYHDLNIDSAANSSELIENFIINIGAGDTIFIDYPYSAFSPGRNYFIAHILNDDEDLYNNVSFFSFDGIETGISKGEIKINEIMYAPDNEPEWIELYNDSDRDIDLKNFRTADRSDTVYITRSSYIMPPSDYLVISSDSALLAKRDIPSQFLKVPIPPLNNTGDRLILLDSLSRAIDSLEYTPAWGGRNGYSLERINFKNQSQDSANWGTSLNKYRGTPGYINSVSEKEYDATVAGTFFNPPYPLKGDSVIGSVLIKNSGSRDSEIELKIFNDDKLIHSSGYYLQGNDSLLVNNCIIIYNLNNLQTFYSEVILPHDQDTTNNYLLTSVYPGYKPGSIVINEVLYSPSSGEPEWIELYNRSEDSIPLQNWSISDVLTSPSASAIKTEYTLLPQSFLVISPDSSVKNYHRLIPSDILICSLPALNNDADGVVLTDERGLTIDSMFYRNNPSPGKSLERISVDISSNLPQNWGSSKDIELSTPGKINSLTVKDFDLSAGGIYLTPRYPVLNDTVFISASVRNTGLNNAASFYVFFYYGIPPDTLLYSGNEINLSAGDSVIITSPVAIQLTHSTTIAFFIHLEDDADPLNNYTEKNIIPGEREGSVIINEIMYDPDEGYSEWVEIYNPSDRAYNLKNWSISDIVPSPFKSFLTSNDIWIYPGEYFIISSDTTVLQLYPEVTKMILSRFGSLSSAGDGIILYDYRDAVIDSMKYVSKWGGKRGRSLERKSVHSSSSDSSNWASSLSPFRATPGQENSVSSLPDIARSSVILNEIMYDPAVDNCEFIELYNRSNITINIGGWRIECGNKNFFIISDTSRLLFPGDYYVFAADSLIRYKYPYIDLTLLSCAGSSSLGLSNSGGELMLKDINGNTVDSLYYTPRYHNRNFIVTKNRALERINPDISSTDESNWSTSTSPEGATPGEVNSIYTGIHAAASGITLTPNPFSPDNDGWEDFAIISYDLKLAAPQLRIKIFDSRGRLVRTLTDNLPSGSKGSVIFDGRDDLGRPLRIGIYILYLEASGESGTEVYKSTFVIARKL